jgi:putative DNA primase/helicase
VTNALLKAALAYARRGWSVFPLNGKLPFTGSHGHLDATTDPEQVRSWWRETPDANIGIACRSSGAGPIVVDVDGEAAEDFISTLTMPSTSEATSGRPHRRHLYFAPALDGTPVRRTLKIDRGLHDGTPSLDILGDGGYVVAPPSIHPKTGEPYFWLEEVTPAAFPIVLLKLIVPKDTKKVAEPLPDVLEEGNRDDMLTSLAGTMRRRGASEEGILAALREENDSRCRPPLSDRDLRKIARSIAKKAPAGVTENLTDLGNARRFVGQHHADVRHVRAWKYGWVVWDGVRWAPDQTGEAERIAKNTVRSIYLQASHVEDPEQREALLKHANRSESAGKVKAILEMAATEPEVAREQGLFDSNDWLLNVENGTLDLKTGALRAHAKDDHITKLAPVEYDETAACERWDEFLLEIMNGDEELVDFLQRAVGYSLTGDIGEHCFFFCYGRGRNGKSTFLEVLRDMLGDYAQQADFATFLARRGEGPRNDLARMRGARFVSAIEAQSDRSFDETVLKQLTGGDTITARKLYEEFFEFKPQHKIFLAANHKPAIREQTEALWSRIRLVPFTVTIPAERRVKNLRELLNAEHSGILNWALDGCRKWRESGLTNPRAIVKATKSYRDENDLMSEFFDARCMFEAKSWLSTQDLYRAFTEWWVETRGPQVKPWLPGAFTRALGERTELRQFKSNNLIRGWKGITLKLEGK